MGSSTNALFICIVLGVLLLFPGGGSEPVVHGLSPKFFRTVSESGFFLQLGALSLLWGVLQYRYGKQAFGILKLLVLFLSYPLILLSLLLVGGVLIGIFGNSSELLSFYLTRLFLYVDIFVCFLFLLLTFFFLRRGFDKDSTDRRSYPGIFLCVVFFFGFSLFALKSHISCTTFECRHEQLLSASSADIVEIIQNFINESPVIRADIGEIMGIARKKGEPIRETHWLDYSGEFPLEVKGKNGAGVLYLNLAGNSAKSIEHYRGRWLFAGKEIPLSEGGILDESAVMFEQKQRQKQQLARLEETGDCAALLALIKKNQEQSKAGTAYSLDQTVTSRIEARCLVELERFDEAAEAYARYAFFVKPHYFREKPADIGSIGEAKSALQRAINISPTHPQRSQWEGKIEILSIQEKLTKRPCNSQLRNELQTMLARNRIHYHALPECTPIK